MKRRPPRSTLFPYTPLFRSDLDRLRAAIEAAKEVEDRPSLIDVKTIIGWPSPEQGTSEVHGKALGEENVRITKERLGWDPRSEEHTSELQSRQYLVCRLLLD